MRRTAPLAALALAVMLAARGAAADAPALVPLPPQPGDVAFPAAAWERAEPAAGGADAARLARALDVAFAEPDPSRPVRTRAVVIVHRGRLVAERYADGFDATTRLQGWSMTKSLTNALVASLVGEGKLSLDGPADVPEWRAAGDPRGAITLRQLLQMSSGLAWSEVYESSPLQSDVIAMLFTTGHRDMAGFAAAKPLAHPPGTVFSYSSGTSLIVSGIVRRALGGASTAYHEFARRALFGPIGMRSALVEADASGTFVGSSYSWATAEDWARFGTLYLRDGVWAGKRILPEGWVDFTRTPAPAATRGEYGAHFWLNAGRGEAPPPIPRAPRDLFYASGHEGQMVAIVPSKDLVLVRLGLTPDDGRFDLDGWAAETIAAFPDVAAR